MTTRNKQTEKDDGILLTEQEVSYVLKFSDALSGYNIYGNALTPMLLNQRMKDITLSPMQATESSISEAMLNPKDSELVLQAFSQDFEIQSQLYRRLLSYLGNMLSFDLTYECINPDVDYTNKKYKSELDIVKKFFDNFDYKREFQSTTLELLRNEAAFYCLRYDKDQIILQELPASPNYTMITGRWASGLLFSLNMYWFLQPGVDLNLYPEFFRKKYNDLWGGVSGKMQKYQPDLSPTARGNSSWVYWQDIPVDAGWCFKFNPTIATRVPYFAGLFLDLIQQPLMRSLQKNVNLAAAARLVMGEIPLLKDTKSTVKDQFSISPSNLGNFLAIVKAAIGDGLKTAAAPLTNIQGIQFASDNELYKAFLRNASALSGVNSNLIFTNDLKMNAIETQLSLNTDEQLMMSLYPSFEQFLNYQVNKLTKNYKFKFHFEGTDFFNNRQQRLDHQMTLATNGIVLPQKIAASIGMSPFNFERQLEEARANDWVGKLTPLTSSFQMSKAEANGRPKKSDGEISEEGEQTRSDGTNIGRGGKV